MTLYEDIVYGPIQSRRFGVSLGVNLLPPRRKVCSFNCVYCQYSWTEPLRSLADLDWPETIAVASAVRAALDAMRAAGRPLHRITIAGHGEPTLHPRFPDVVSGLRGVRDEAAPGVPLSILSNSTTVHLPAIRDALARLDERNMKLDAGRQQELRQVNASRVPIEQIVAGLAALPDIAIQAMFVRDALGRIDNTAPAAVDAWLGALERIRPRVVQVYTIARTPALPSLVPVGRAVLDRIAGRVAGLGIATVVVA
jgi:wyosine [tRNA(Phe)-imidazoG37] synthetase (radical SAM superfamily)